MKGAPGDIETEFCLLRHVIDEGGGDLEAILELGLCGDDFTTETHRQWWDLMMEHHEAGTLGVATLLMDATQDVETVRRYGGHETITRLTTGTEGWRPNQPMTGLGLARRVRQLALRRVAWRAALVVQDQACDPTVEIGQVREVVETMLSKLFDAETRRQGWRHLGELMGEEARDAVARSEGRVPAVACRTTIQALDRLLGGGFRPGELVLVAGRPAHGKSAAAAVLAVEAAKQGQRVALFSLEMAGSQVAQRCLARLAEVPLQFIRSGSGLGAEDWDRFDRAVEVGRALPFYVDDYPGVSLARVRTQLRQLRRTVGAPGLVVVDYVQLMEGDRRKGDSRATEVGALSRGLKVLAREFACPVIALSQINRKVEERAPEDRRPMVSDLAESGKLEQDADIILLVHRPEVYDDGKDPAWRGKMEVIVGKARNGQTGRTTLTWRGEFQDLEEAGAGVTERAWGYDA